MKLLTPLSFAFLIFVVGFTGDPVSANASIGSDWYPYTIARGKDRDIIKSMPIESRPNRPLHFYGNTVRRRIDLSTRQPGSGLLRPSSSRRSLRLFRSR
ncbi:MAG: hypothetical protein AAF939_06515 [Planctomycetota bacterium]